MGDGRELCIRRESQEQHKDLEEEHQTRVTEQHRDLEDEGLCDRGKLQFGR